MTRVKFLDAARTDVLEAAAFYEREQSALGERFRRELRRSIGRILAYPEAWSPLSPRTRRCLVNTFPYGVIYQVGGDAVLIVAVMHLHRDPESWRSRVTKAGD